MPGCTRSVKSILSSDVTSEGDPWGRPSESVKTHPVVNDTCNTRLDKFWPVQTDRPHLRKHIMSLHTTRSGMWRKVLQFKLHLIQLVHTEVYPANVGMTLHNALYRRKRRTSLLKEWSGRGDLARSGIGGSNYRYDTYNQKGTSKLRSGQQGKITPRSTGLFPNRRKSVRRSILNRVCRKS